MDQPATRATNIQVGRAECFAVIDEVRAAFADVSDDEIERETDRILSENAQEGDNEPDAARS